MHLPSFVKHNTKRVLVFTSTSLLFVALTGVLALLGSRNQLTHDTSSVFSPPFGEGQSFTNMSEKGTSIPSPLVIFSLGFFLLTQSGNNAIVGNTQGANGDPLAALASAPIAVGKFLISFSDYVYGSATQNPNEVSSGLYGTSWLSQVGQLGTQAGFALGGGEISNGAVSDGSLGPTTNLLPFQTDSGFPLATSASSLFPQQVDSSGNLASGKPGFMSLPPPPGNTFRAAALEFAGIYENPYPSFSRAAADTLMLRNIELIDFYAYSASYHGAQILVLPEYALTATMFSDGINFLRPTSSAREAIFPFAQIVPKTGTNPCNSAAGTYPAILVRLSCMAKQHNISLVANIAELDMGVPISFSANGFNFAGYSTSSGFSDFFSSATSSTASSSSTVSTGDSISNTLTGISTAASIASLLSPSSISGGGLLNYAQANLPTTKMYNSNVLFDEKGTIIGKYRKVHLFVEDYFDVGSEAAEDLPIVQTSFGTVGMLTCFDILFPDKNPVQGLVQRGVKNLLMPTAWVNPFALIGFDTGARNQQLFSGQQQVNLVAAALGVSSTDSGSGIYTKGTVLAQYYNAERQASNRLLLGDVPLNI